MEPDEEFVNILFKIVRQCNKTHYNTFTVKDAPIFVTVKELQEFFFKKFGVELAPAATAESFRLGYIAGTNCRMSISNSTQLAEAYSLGFIITLWADPDIQKKSTGTSVKRTYSKMSALECQNDEGI